MRILVIGSGGREHALAWKLSQSPAVEKIFMAPGNGGSSQVAESIPLGPDKIKELADFAQTSNMDLTVVGPEAPLVHGLVDYFKSRNLKVFGPTKAAARLEGSKAFAKEIMQKYKVPTAVSRTFRDKEEAVRYLEKSPLPVVVKADGLAGGKGVVVAKTREEAMEAANRFLGGGVFGEAYDQVVIEEFLQGQELSILALVDGTHFTLLAPSQDHKRALGGDKGPNTGGMGAYSPVPLADAKLIEQVCRTIFEPVIRGMCAQGTPFQGVLYAGLMLTPQGPKVLEFNVRFGDPETQAILPRLKSDLAQLLMNCVEGRLDKTTLQWDARHCACVVMASGGYPEKYDIGRPITGLEKVSTQPGTLLFHAGTKQENGRLITWGGRVLNVVGLGDTLEAALEKAYAAVDQIQFEGKFYRRDIGAQALKQKSFLSGAHAK